MENWKPGDLAYCINNGDIFPTRGGIIPSLRLHVEYVVHEVDICPCGSVSLDVGLSSPIGVKTYCECDKPIKGDGVHWCASVRFVKKKEIEAKVAEAVIAEDYILASELMNKIVKEKVNG